MRKIIAIISLLFLSSCADVFDFGNEVDNKRLVTSNTSVVYPSLPDLEKPVFVPLKPVVFDYPRDTTKPKQIKATLECLREPRVANFDQVCLEHPIIRTTNIHIGMNQTNFKNYISNQEQTHGYIRLLEGRIDEINAERRRWREANQQKDN